MPRMNGTGPQGMGAGTGRRLGKCAGKEPGNDLERLGRGMAARRRSVKPKETPGQGKRLRYDSETGTRE